jgi:hypothetical protein
MKPSPFNNKSPSEILALYQRYRANERVRTLLVELGLGEMNDSHFYRLFANVRINELCCSICGGAPMLATLPSKSNSATKILHTCQNCEHTVISNIEGDGCTPVNDCKCKHCVEARKKQQEDQSASFMDRIRKAFKNQRALPCQAINEASLTVLVGLHALLYTWAAEDMTRLLPLQDRPEHFWPTKDKSVSSLSKIYRESLLNVDLEHCTAAAFVENPDSTISWYTIRAALIPSIRVATDTLMTLPDTLGYLAGLLPDGLSNQQKSELPLLMRAIAVDECIQYMQYLLGEYGFNSNTGEKTGKIVEELLHDLPVNQIMVCIWTAVKGAAAFIQSPHCKGRKHAFNTIHGKLRKAALRRIASGLESKGFDRHKYCPRSEISFSLYGLLGFDGDVGFVTRLKDIPIPEKWRAPKEEEPDFEYMLYTHEEHTVLKSHGFEVRYQFDAARRLPFSGQVIQVFKIKAAQTYFELSVSSGVDGEFFTAKLETLDALLFYLIAFEKCNQLAEMLGL